MQSRYRFRTSWLLVLLILAAACTAPGQHSSAGSQAAAPAGQTALATPNRVVVAIAGDPNTLNNSIGRAGSGGVPGVDAMEELVNAGLTQIDDNGLLRPQLAEAVPAIENGRWKLFPDGSMQTTW